MLFRKKEYRFCANCLRGVEADEDHVLCPKKGFVAKEHCCGRFRYDPLKRMPCRLSTADFSAFSDSDFQL